MKDTHKRFYLSELCVEITGHCLMNCIHCSTFHEEGCNTTTKFTPTNKLKEIIKEFKQLGGKIIELSGGEPLLHPQLTDIIKEAKNSGLEVRLYTSGLIQNKKLEIVAISKKLAEDLLKSGLDKIIFNLQGPNPEIHELVTRTPGSFSKLVESIKNVKALGLWVGTHFVPLRYNWTYLEDVINFCINNHVDELALLRFVPQGRGQLHKKQIQLDAYEFNKFLKITARLYEKYKDKLSIRIGCPLGFVSIYNREIEHKTCKAGRSTCYIDFKGNVLPCPGFKHIEEHIAGNIYDNSLENIWNNSLVFFKFRKFDSKTINGMCRNCEEFHWCKGGCLAQRVRAYARIYMAPDPGCPKLLEKERGVSFPQKSAL